MGEGGRGGGGGGGGVVCGGGGEGGGGVHAGVRGSPFISVRNAVLNSVGLSCARIVYITAHGRRRA